MKNIFILFTLLSCYSSFGQLIVNGKDLNKTVKSFELHMAVKPFTSKQSLYIDYGQDGFKEVNYDLSDKQSVYDSLGQKFSKGEYMKLSNYLDATGWIRDNQRESKLGDVKINIMMYRRKD